MVLQEEVLPRAGAMDRVPGQAGIAEGVQLRKIV